MGSNHVADKVGNNNADGILNLLRGHVFTHEEFSLHTNTTTLITFVTTLTLLWRAQMEV